MTRPTIFPKAVFIFVFGMGVVLFCWWFSKQDSAPVQITFLGYTNYNQRTLALFAITNHQKRDLRGFAYVQKWAGNQWPVKSAWPLPHMRQIQTPTGPVMSNYQVWSFSGNTAPLADQHQIWVGSCRNPPHNGMTLGIPKPMTTNSWKLALLFPVSIKNWTNAPTARDRLADYCFAKGHIKLAHRIKPAASKPLFQYGPEMLHGSPSNPAK
jgi:hypothetical protein